MATDTAAFSAGNGVNLQPSYYNNGQVNFGWELMRQQSAISTVRIEIEPGKETAAAAWIAEAQANNYQVIATYHKSAVLGSNNVNDLLAAATWWIANYKSLGGNFTINLMNEWGDHQLSATAYADACNQAIAMVRQVYSGPVIIDVPGWGQDTHTAYAAVMPGSALITDTNIVLSVHIYKGSWNSHTGEFLTPADLDELASAGLPCMVGEFGTAGAGTCDWGACVDHARDLGWPVIGWCWNGDGNGLNMVSPAWSDTPAAVTFTKSSYFGTIYQHLAATT